MARGIALEAASYRQRDVVASHAETSQFCGEGIAFGLLLADQSFARDALRQFQRLALEQSAIDPAFAPNEAGMGAFFGDMSMFEDQQPIERAHS